MPEQTILRVGICDCTHLYLGKFQGRSVIINDHAFVIEEVLIPQNAHRDGLMSTRAHFFLDLHWFGKRARRKAWVQLARIDIIQNGSGKKERLCFGGLDFRRRYKNRRWWDNKEPARVNTIAESIREILGDMTPEQMIGWLDQMKS